VKTGFAFRRPWATWNCTSSACGWPSRFRSGREHMAVLEEQEDAEQWLQ
jgi:hypothetical protein